MANLRLRSVWIWAFIAFILSALFAVTNPPYESPDEPEHLNFVQYVAANSSLPNQYEAAKKIGQGHHLPLYYLIGAGLCKLIGGPEIDLSAVALNPNSKANGGTEINVPLFLDHKTVLANKARFYGLRLMSCLFCALSVLVVGFGAAKLISNKYYWIAPMLLATLPQYLFVGSSITNDALASLLAASCTVYFALFFHQQNKRLIVRMIIGGALLALALLSKKSCIIMLPAVALLLLIKEDFTIKQRFNMLVAVAVGFVLVAGPYLLRNFSLYGEILGNQMERNTLTGLIQEKSLLDRYFLTEFSRAVARSFVGHFGWMNVPLPTIMIGAYWLTTLVPIACALKTKVVESSIKTFLVAIPILALAGLIYYNLSFTQPQGRLLFPSLGAIALLFGIGGANWISLCNFRAQKVLTILLPIAFVGFAVASIAINARFY